MVRLTPFRRDSKLSEHFYCQQAGHGIPVFIGGLSQRGHELGSFFSEPGRMVMPWLKTGGKALRKEGLKTGFQVAQYALSGRNVGEAFIEHAKQVGQRLRYVASNHLFRNK